MSTQNEKPIIFSTSMVQAILNGSKSQSRRVVKPPAPYDYGDEGIDILYATGNLKCPYGQVGDRLWVRETHRYIQGDGEPHDFGVWYKADGEYKWWNDNEEWMAYPIDEKTRPSIHMPRWASRITLEITNIRVERLQEIHYPDLLAEGSYMATCVDDEGGFVNLWNSINTKEEYFWNSNPWVWVIEFRKAI